MLNKTKRDMLSCFIGLFLCAAFSVILFTSLGFFTTSFAKVACTTMFTLGFAVFISRLYWIELYIFKLFPDAGRRVFECRNCNDFMFIAEEATINKCPKCERTEYVW